MSSKPHTDPVYKEKKVPKTPIKFNVQLNEEQKKAKTEIYENDIILLKGKAGSSKTMLACNVALDLLFKKQIDRIFVARPSVYAEGEKLGYLPGGINEKLVGLTTPILENMYILYNKIAIDKLVEEGEITILPVAFMRGLTLQNSCLILDEWQNATYTQTYMALSRMGKGTKIIATGDMAQCDLPNKKDSGFDFFRRLETSGLPKFKIIELLSNHRHDAVEHISKVYDEFRG